ncbi:MAG: tagaturonate reductase, partial [Lewinella sp.]
MQQLNRANAEIGTTYPEVILQFGGGNFLRAFTDWIIDVYNEKNNTQIGILVATTTERKGYTDWNGQDGLYHLITKGIDNGEIIDETRLIKSVSRVISMEPNWDDFLKTAENPDTRYVISNTTEAGIRFNPDDKWGNTAPSEFPAKLTLWLYRRYQFFGGKSKAGCVFLPVELINDNGDALRNCLLRYCEHW